MVTRSKNKHIQDSAEKNWFARHKITAFFILIFMGVAIPLLLLEIGSYIFGTFPVAPDPLITEQHERWTNLREFDPLLFWRLKSSLNRGVIETNSKGLRSPEVPRKKKNEFRILSLGESTTFGLGIKYENTYSALIESDLKSLNKKPLRVINGGVSGYTLFQGYTYLRYRGIKLKPDAVMIYFGYNDFLQVAFLGKRDALSSEGTAGLNDWELFDQRQNFFSKTSVFLAQHSNFVRGIKSLFRRDIDPQAVREHREKVRVPHDHRLKLLKMFQDLCQENEILFIIIVPWYLHFTEHAPLLREFAEQDDIPIIDLPQKLMGLTQPKESYFRDRLHPTPRGHELIAEAIEKKLLKLWPETIIK